MELGLLGLGLHVASLCGGVVAGVQRARSGNDLRGGYGLVVAATAFGIALNELTANVFNSVLLVCAFFWLLGSLVSASFARDRE